MKHFLILSMTVLYFFNLSFSQNIETPGFQISDERAKENIGEISDAVGLLEKLKPVAFEWKSAFLSSGQSKKSFGFIAQDVEQRIPQLVTKTSKSFGGNSYSDFRLLNTEAITALLVSTVQEQQAIIKKQSGDIWYLLSRMKEQTEMLDQLKASHELMRADLETIKKHAGLEMKSFEE